MADITYRVVEHDGGWAYRLGDVFSEPFGSHDAARAAAEAAAREQRTPGDTALISWEGPDGVWHEETVQGDDRPNTSVEG